MVCQTYLKWENDCFKYIFEISNQFPTQEPENKLQNLVKSERKVVSKFELPETHFERIVREKIVCKTYLELENDCFKHIFGISIKFPI